MATGVRPVFPEAPPDTRAEQLTDPHIGKDGFLDLFGRPPRESRCECERRSDLSLPQALNLVNGKTISDAVADAERADRESRFSAGRGGSRAGRRAVSGVAEPAADRGGDGEAAWTYLQSGREPRGARAGSVVGAVEQQSVFVQLLGRRWRSESC